MVTSTRYYEILNLRYYKASSLQNEELSLKVIIIGIGKKASLNEQAQRIPKLGII